MSLNAFMAMTIQWNSMKNSAYGYRAAVDGRHLLIRLNNFPEPIYTLIVDSQDTLDFELWPKTWEKLPSDASHDLRETAEPHTDLNAWMRRTITWEATGNAVYPNHAEVEGRNLLIRLNDFPVEPLYTLIVDSQDTLDFDQCPENWERPQGLRTLPKTHTE